MGRRSRSQRRTPAQAAADRAADLMVGRVGSMLRDARLAQAWTIEQAAARAGISRSTWSRLEIGSDGRTTFATMNRAATAVGRPLRSYLEHASAVDQPRDIVHLRNQETVMALAARGGWRARPEVPLDRNVETSRMADLVLQRGAEWALVEVIDWFGDVGSAARAWQRRLDALERHALARMRDDRLPSVSGVWVIRATRRNRQLLAAHARFFRAVHEASGHAWLASLCEPTRAMPGASGLVWVSVRGDRLFAARLGGSALGGSALGGSALGGSALGGSALGGSALGGDVGLPLDSAHAGPLRLRA